MEAYCLCEMGVDVPKEAVSAILDEQSTWKYYRQRKTRVLIITTGACVSPRRGEEEDHIIRLRAVGSSTAEYVGSSSESAALDDYITPDDDNEPNDLDGGGDDIEDLLEEDEEDDIADKVPLMFFFGINALISYL